MALALAGVLVAAGCVFSLYPFGATPLTDFSPGKLYLNTFQGFLYDGSNMPPPDHDAGGRASAAHVRPLDLMGNPSPSGKIVVVGLGMSNWTDELCGAVRRRTDPCPPHTFLGMAAADARVNHASLVLLDCARSGYDAKKWLDDAYGSYSLCMNGPLASRGVSEGQVQVILWKNANALGGAGHTALTPAPGLSPSAYCAASAHAAVDACIYERHLGTMVRYANARYPNLKQVFVHTRIYAGYASSRLNPEPYAYEYGFANKWFVAAQIRQRRTGAVDPTAGDLSARVAPWVGWGPYFWASGAEPRRDGLGWSLADFEGDYTHPSTIGARKVAVLMMDFYLASPYAPWFRASGR